MDAKPRKKQKVNGFLLFTHEWIKDNQFVGSLGSATSLTGHLWPKLDVKTKKAYNDKAKELNNRNSMSCTGVPLAMIEKEKKESEMLEKEMNLQIEREIKEALGAGNLLSKKFYIIAFNYFTRTLRGGYYIPAEIAAVEFSLEDGIIATFHKCVNPQISLLGEQYDAQKHSNETHRLPVPPNAIGETDMKSLYKSILDFAKEEKTGIRRAFYAKHDDVEKIQSALTLVKNVAGIDEIIVIFPLENLMQQMKNPRNSADDLKIKSEIYNLIERVDYTNSNAACQFHRKIDIVEACASSIGSTLAIMLIKYIQPYPQANTRLDEHNNEIDLSGVASSSRPGVLRERDHHQFRTIKCEDMKYIHPSQQVNDNSEKDASAVSFSSAVFHNTSDSEFLIGSGGRQSNQNCSSIKCEDMKYIHPSQQANTKLDEQNNESDLSGVVGSSRPKLLRGRDHHQVSTIKCEDMKYIHPNEQVNENSEKDKVSLSSAVFHSTSDPGFLRGSGRRPSNQNVSSVKCEDMKYLHPYQQANTKLDEQNNESDLSGVVGSSRPKLLRGRDHHQVSTIKCEDMKYIHPSQQVNDNSAKDASTVSFSSAVSHSTSDPGFLKVSGRRPSNQNLSSIKCEDMKYIHPNQQVNVKLDEQNNEIDLSGVASSSRPRLLRERDHHQFSIIKCEDMKYIHPSQQVNENSEKDKVSLSSAVFHSTSDPGLLRGSGRRPSSQNLSSIKCEDMKYLHPSQQANTKSDEQNNESDLFGVASLIHPGLLRGRDHHQVNTIKCEDMKYIHPSQQVNENSEKDKVSFSSAVFHTTSDPGLLRGCGRRPSNQNLSSIKCEDMKHLYPNQQVNVKLDEQNNESDLSGVASSSHLWLLRGRDHHQVSTIKCEDMKYIHPSQQVNDNSEKDASAVSFSSAVFHNTSDPGFLRGSGRRPSNQNVSSVKCEDMKYLHPYQQANTKLDGQNNESDQSGVATLSRPGLLRGRDHHQVSTINCEDMKYVHPSQHPDINSMNATPDVTFSSEVLHSTSGRGFLRGRGRGRGYLTRGRKRPV
ncbi:uncharacterized protein LOC119687418 [Teleopsis dalmanni]|uniref:uncharacterized protein LOC119687418 n=1 Tax=Teleopsis dalmanni TaxID=139649 RepID=UPI0018CDF2A2|nr:uncharacterized protein LOC119687418 [Teleopsis dalmanni]